MRFGLGPFAAEAAGRVDATEAYEIYRESVQFAEDAGFESAWIAERHFAEDGYCPQVFVAAANLAAKTETIRIGVLPILGLTHPIYVAEDATTLDNLTGGRAIVVPINAVKHEIEGYGLSEAEYESRYRESFGVLFKAWSARPFHHQGENWTIPAQFEGHVENKSGTVTVTPKPVQFELPLWVGGFWEPGRKLAAELGLPVVLGAISDNEALGQMWSEYEKNSKRAVRPPRVLIRDVYVSTSSDPLSEVADKFTRQFERYNDWGLWSGDTSNARALAGDKIIIGNPDEVIAQLRDLDDAHGVDHLIARMHFPGMRLHELLASMSLFSREVIPEFKMPDLPRQIREGV